MSTQYDGTLVIYGGKATLQIMQEAQRRLVAKSGKARRFDVDDVVDVFFGSRDDTSYRQIGCSGLVFEELTEVAGRQIQFEIFFSTQSSYPDYLARYLVNKIASIDPAVKIKIDCIGDGIYEHKETIMPNV